MKAKRLWRAIGDLGFLLVSQSFMEVGCLGFASIEEAKQFMLKFLVLECISGSNSDEDLMRAYEIIHRWVLVGRTISSEELPIGRHKTHEQKNLVNVMYYVSDNNCCYMKL